MSKFLPDPQIQSLRAMRAGDIAFALPAPLVMTIGKSSVAFAQPKVTQSKSLIAVPSTGPVTAVPSENPTVSRSFVTRSSRNVSQAVSASAVPSLESLSGTPSESPVVGVATATSVV